MATKAKSKSVKKAAKSTAKKGPAKKSVGKAKSASSKKVAKKAPVKKTATPKKAVKKAPVKKVQAKKTAKKAPAKKKVVAKKPVKKAPSRKQKPAKKPAAKTTSSKKTATPKKAVKKAPVKKPVAKKAAKKSAAKKATPKKKTASVKKTPAAKKRPALPPVRKELPPVRPLHAKPTRSKNIKPLTAKELAGFRKALIALRDQVVDGISFLSGDNLNRSQRDVSGDLSGYSLHMADQGTDNNDREIALNLVSSEQDLLYEIDEAIRRIDAGTYGICELTGEPIERARLKVIPYARLSVVAQSELEKGKKRYRPFGPTLTR